MREKRVAIEWAGTYMAPGELSSLDWLSIEKIAGVTFTEPQRKTLLAALNTYLARFSLQQQLSHIKDLKLHLKKIKTHARTLRSLLGDGSGTAQTALFHTFPWDMAEPLALNRLLGEWALRAERYEGELSGKAGRPENLILAPLIRAWFAVYQEAGGKRGCYWHTHAKKYRGRFLDLLETAFLQASAQLCAPTVKQLSPIRVPRAGLAQAILASIPPSRQQRRSENPSQP